ncbi:MAG TPA: hypothetical protein ENJ09_08195 [Planctomycetes bacterium]|nr:hypothetical protein [Planctomycetota bacterium]
MKTRIPVLLLSLPLAVACGDKGPISKVLEPEAANQKLRQEVQRLREAGYLDAVTEGELPGDPHDFFERLDGLDDFLDTCPDWDDSSLSNPEWWNSESADTLAQRLAPLDPFFEELSSLLHLPDAEKALASGLHLARRTRPGPEPLTREEEYDVYATPRARRVSRWIDLLCARAVASASTAVHSEEAAASLSDAFDLLWLLEDDSMRGVRTVSGLESEVLRCLQIVAPGPVIDPRLLRSQMEPRLARLGGRARVFRLLRREVSRRVEIAELVLSEPGRADQDHWLTELGSSRALLAEHALEAIDIQDNLRAASSLCLRIAQYGPSGADGGDHTFQELLDGVAELHDLENYIYLARIALAANEWRFLEGEWPRFVSDLTFGDQPAPRLECRSRRLTYRREFSIVELALVGRQGSSTDPNPLSTWIWDAETLKAFRESGN